MFKPSDRLRAGMTEAVGVVLAATLLTPVVALAGVATLDPATAAAKPAPHPAAPVQVRCWQEGRLLFEENGVTLPDPAHYTTVVAGTDRQGRPMYVAETRNATCLIRQATPERTVWPR